MKIELKAVSKKSKLIHIDGERAGIVDWESQSMPNTLSGPGRRASFWSGFVRWDGQKLGLNKIEKASDIVAKIEREIARHEAQKTAPSLEEAGMISRLANRAVNGIKSAAADTKDRLAYGFGDHGALGEIGLRSATKELTNQWSVYARRNARAEKDQSYLTNPNLEQLADFLQFQYGLTLTPEQITAAMSGKKAAPAKAEAPAVAPQTATEAILQRLAIKAVISEAPTMPPVDAPDEEEHEAGPADITFDPKQLFPRLANMLMNAGLLKVDFKGGVSVGSLHGKGAEEENDGPVAVTPEQAAQIASKITDDGYHLDMIKLSKQLGAKNVSLAQMNWLQQNIHTPMDVRQVMLRQKDEKTDNRDTVELLTTVATTIADCFTKQELKGNNITSLGSTVDVDKMAKMLKAENIDGTVLQIMANAAKDPDKFAALLIRENDAATRAVAGVIKAFSASMVRATKGKK